MRGLCKKSMAVLLCLAMTFASLTMTTYGETTQSIWDGDAKTEPSTESDVYQITNGAELAWFADYVNQGNSEVKAELKNDIDLGSKEWTPIGNNTKKFAGTFDGNGYAIHNLKIDCEKNYIGLFGYLAAGASVTDFSLDGSITSTYVNGGGYAAGVAGYATGTTAKKINITKIHNACDVSVQGNSAGSYAGGILGGAGTGVVIEDCSNTGNITGTQKAVGGIAGSAKTVKQCYNTGAISGGASVAGIAGVGSTETIENCYNTGTITGTNFVGGISAASNGTAIPVTNCYNTGDIEIIGTLTSKDDILASVGGVVDNCYTTGQKEDSAYGLGQCVTAQELRSMADELGKAFACNLHVDYNQGLPVLAWELETAEWKALADVTVESVKIAEDTCHSASVKYGTEMTQKMQIVLGFADDIILETAGGNVSVPATWISDTYDAQKAGVYEFTPVYDMPSGGKTGDEASTDKVQVTVREEGAAAPTVTRVTMPENAPSEIVVKYGAKELGLTNYAEVMVDDKLKTVYIDWEMEEEFSVTAPGVYVATAYFPEEYTLAKSVQMPTVQITVKEQGYIGSLTFAPSSVGETYVMSPVYDETVKEYTLWVPDTKNMLYCTAALDESVKSGTIQADYMNTSDKETTKTVTLGKAMILPTCVKAGSATSEANSNVITLTATDSASGNTQTYTITIKRTRSISSLGISCNESAVNYLPAFSSTNYDYSADVSDSVNEIALDVKALAKDSVLTVTSDAVAGTINAGSDGTYPITLSAVSDSTMIGIAVADAAGEGKTLYTMTVNKRRTANVTFNVTPADAVVLVKDSFGKRIYEEDNGSFALLEGRTYSYTVSTNGYVAQKGSFEAEDDTRTVVLTEAAKNGKINEGLYAEWSNFGKNAENNAIVNRKSPVTASGSALYWTTKLGSGYGGQATGAPLIVGGYIISTAGSNIYKVDRFNGEIVAKGTMCGASNFSIVPPTYANGMLFVGLSNGTIQAFDAQTLESLWIFRDELKGQPNTPIKYYDGYIYTGFWNSETADANFVCVSVTDEDINRTDEDKYATWTHTQAGGFYWAGAYVCSDYVLVGTDDGESGYTSQTSELLSLDLHTGKVIDRISGLNADIRSSICYDDVTGRYYATSKGGSFYSFVMNEDGSFKKDAEGLKGYDLIEINLGGMSTSTPVVYNGRAYVGVSGSSQFGQNSGHCIAVIDLVSFTIAYRAATKGYPQTSGLLTTAYDEDGYVYVYFLDNYTPGWVRCIKDKPGVTEVVDPYVEVNKDGTLSEYAPILFTPSGAQAQYAICTPIVDEYGTLYFKNDSAYLMAVGSNIEKIVVEKQPDKVHYETGEDFDASGMAVYAYLENGLKRDVTDYIKIISGEALEEGRREVSISYDGLLYHDTEENVKTASGASIHASGVKLDVLYTEVQITVGEEPEDATQPAVSAEPAASGEPEQSAEPAASEAVKASANPVASEEAKASANPAASEEAKASANPAASEDVKASANPAASEEAKASANPSASEAVKASANPAASEEAKASANPAASEAVKASANPAASGEPKESAAPVTSEKPNVSSKPLVTPLPVQKQENGAFEVSAQACTVQAVGDVLDTTGSAFFIEQEQTETDSEYKKAEQALKGLQIDMMRVLQIQFVDENSRIIGLKGTISISFRIPDNFDKARVRVARIKNSTIQDAVSDDYELYNTVISADGKTATIETDALGTFVMMTADNYPDITPGDVTQDGEVKLDDAQKTLKAALKLAVLTDDERKAADVDNDGSITLADAQMILKYALKLIKSFDK